MVLNSQPPITEVLNSAGSTFHQHYLDVHFNQQLQPTKVHFILQQVNSLKSFHIKVQLMQHEQSLHSTDICNLPVRPNIHSTFTWYMFFVLFFSHFLNKIVQHCGNKVYACFFPESEVRRFLFIYVSCVQNWSLDAVSLAQHTDWKGVTAILALSKVKKKHLPTPLKPPF